MTQQTLNGKKSYSLMRGKISIILYIGAMIITILITLNQLINGEIFMILNILFLRK
jgi:hypothetical protein